METFIYVIQEFTVFKMREQFVHFACPVLCVFLVFSVYIHDVTALKLVQR